jgi:hypothetical protein
MHRKRKEQITVSAGPADGNSGADVSFDAGGRYLKRLRDLWVQRFADPKEIIFVFHA